jgi:16S rRNA (cytosine1402-N4)-methyltransferase
LQDRGEQDRGEQEHYDQEQHGDPADVDPRRVHQPVLLAEVLAGIETAFGPDPAGLFVDGTVGAAGHAAAVLERFPRLRLLGFDWDPDSLALASQRLQPFGPRARLTRARLSELAQHLAKEPEAPLALLVDLGVCSLHFDRPERGFSVQADGPLDMRMDPSQERTAAHLLAALSETQLADLLYHEGGETRARRVAQAIVEARRRVPFLRTGALAQLIERTLGPGGRIHPATRTFQALRRAVNREDLELEALLECAQAHLAPGGLLATISFHSLEDGVIKRFLKAAQKRGDFAPLTKEALGPGRDELRQNARSRSARLRLWRRQGGPGVQP